MARLDSFLRLVAEQGASDLHFNAGTVPLIRHDGDLMAMPFRKLSASDAKRFLSEILTDEQRQSLQEQREIDFVYTIEGTSRFRVNMFNHSRGMGGVFRVIRKQTPTLEELGLPSTLRKLLNTQNGLIIVCGPTGSGKTNTLAAMVETINVSDQAKHIISVEDPLEIVFEPKNSVVTQRQVGLHCETFSSALRSALREAPDVIVVGEMRDLETISLALSAAETGTLVLGTLHTNSAAKAIDRLIDAYPDEVRDQQRGVISVLLRGIIAQHLVKKANAEGRVAVLEILINNYATANMIRENKVHLIESYLATIDRSIDGSQGLDKSILKLIKQGIIEDEEGLKIAHDPDTLRKSIETLQEEA